MDHITELRRRIVELEGTLPILTDTLGQALADNDQIAIVEVERALRQQERDLVAARADLAHAEALAAEEARRASQKRAALEKEIRRRETLRTEREYYQLAAQALAAKAEIIDLDREFRRRVGELRGQIDGVSLNAHQYRLRDAGIPLPELNAHLELGVDPESLREQAARFLARAEAIPALPVPVVPPTDEERLAMERQAATGRIGQAKQTLRGLFERRTKLQVHKTNCEADDNFDQAAQVAVELAAIEEKIGLTEAERRAAAEALERLGAS